MAVVGRAAVLVTPSFKGFQKQVADETGPAGEQGGRTFGNRFSTGFKRVAKVGVAAGAALVGAALTKGFGRLKAIEEAQAKLRGLGHDANSVDAIMQNALASVKGTAFGLGEAATTAASLVAAGVEPGKDLERTLKSVANGASAAGIGMDEMGSIFGKVFSSGKAQNDSLQQVADKGIPIYQALADQLGVTTEEVFKMASAGEISAEQFESAMTKASGTVAKEMGTSFTGRLSNAWAALGRIGANLLSGVFPKLGAGLGKITDALGPMEDKAAQLGEAFGEWLSKAVTGLVQMAGWLQRNSSWLLPIVSGVLAMVAAYKTYIGVVKLVQFVTKAWAAAQALLNLVMSLNPIGLVIAAIVGLGVALVVAYRKSETFRNIVNAAWAGIKKVVGTVVGWFTGTALPFMQKVFSGISDAAKWLWNGIKSIFTRFKPLFIGLAAVAAIAMGPLGIAGAFILAYKKSETFRNIVQAVVGAVVGFVQRLWAGVKTAFAAISNAFRAVGNTFRAVWTGFLSPVFQLVGAIVKWLAVKIFKPYINSIVAIWRALGAGMKRVQTSVIKPVIDWIKKAITLMRNTIRAQIAAVRTIWSALGTAIRSVYSRHLKPIVDAFKRIVAAMRSSIRSQVNAVKSVWSGMGSAIRSTYNRHLKPIVDALKSKIKTVKDAFRTAVDGVKTQWNKLEGIAKKPIKFVVNTVINDGLIAAFNKLAGAFGTSKMSKVSLPRGFRSGGWTGPGAAGQPAGVVHADEFVISKAARRSIERKHPGLLNHMLLYGDVPGYKKGGRVWPLKGSKAWTTYAGHTGIDFPRAGGTPVFATEAGTISKAAKLATSYGWHYFLRGKSGITTIYAHLSSMMAKLGQSVAAGTQIGRVGTTGNSTGNHLHFETRPGGTSGAAAGYLGGAGAPKGGILASAISKVMGAFSSVKSWLVDKFSGPLDKLKEITGSPFGRLAAGLPRKIKGDLIDYAVDKMSFDSGGMLQPGYTLAYNGTRRPEPVFTAKQFDGMQAGGPQRMVGELVLKNGKAYIEGIVSDVAADALTARSY